MLFRSLLGNYVFYDFKPTTKPKDRPNISQITLFSSISAKSFKEVERSARIAAQSTYLVRDLINTPPNYLNPETFAQIIRKEVAGSKIKIKIYDEKQLRAGGFGGLIGVGQGSINPPRLVHLSYQPTKSRKHVALVGKGITFDSGGLALKPANEIGRAHV